MREALPVLLDLRQTIGYLVADARGRVVGRVECPMYGTARDIPDALSVRSGFLSRRRRLVPAGTIEETDCALRLQLAVVLASKHRQIALEFPRCELNAVLVPLLPLELDVAVEDVPAKRLLRQV